MTTVTDTELKNNLYKYLDRVSKGESVIVIRNNKKIAHLMPPVTTDWRDKMKNKLKLKVPPEELIQPVDL